MISDETKIHVEMGSTIWWFAFLFLYKFFFTFVYLCMCAW